MLIHTVQAGYSGTLGTDPLGWFGAVAVIDDVDAECNTIRPEGLGQSAFELNAGITFQDWISFSTGQDRRLVYLDGRQTVVAEVELARAERINGPAIPKGTLPFPVVGWSELHEGRWRLRLKIDERVTTVVRSPGQIRTPSIAVHNGRCFVASAVDVAKGSTRVRVYDESGDIYYETDGRRPQLVSNGLSLYLVCEVRSRQGDGISLRLDQIAGRNTAKSWIVEAGDINIQADVIAHPVEHRIVLAWESMPMWGMDHGVGRHKDLHVWLCDDGRNPEPIDGVAGVVPLPREAYLENLDGISGNISVACPKLSWLGGQLGLFMRRFRLEGFKLNGWDACVTRRIECQWTPLMVASPSYGPPDCDFSVVEHDDDVNCLFPSYDCLSWNRAENHRAEVHSLEWGNLPELPSVPLAVRAAYEYPYPVRGVGREPPQPSEPFPLQLVWADLHVHTSYSKCTSSVDGSVDENLRYYRDVLGCKVLTITDHPRHMSGAEHVWVMDKLEESCDSDCVVIYSAEPNCEPDHHTNLYSVDRRAFDSARIVSLTNWSRGDLYAALKKFTSDGSIVALRHFHGSTGPRGVDSDYTLQTWDPDLEVAMEASQQRGNMMVDRDPDPAMPNGMPLFPSNFLNAGARLGLVAGTDHSSHAPRNRLCLTGFWVSELSKQGVWDAITARRTVASSNGKVAIWTELEGKPMGSEIELDGPVEIVVRISSAWPIRRAYLLRDGIEVGSHTVEGNVCETILRDDDPEPGYHWYVVTIEGESAYSMAASFDTLAFGRTRSNTLLAHASPYFVNVLKAPK